MKIMADFPENWIDLQNKAADVLIGCGYVVETPKTVKTVRGEVELDVYAQKNGMKIICECKYWEQNVSQTTIFALRTIMQDTGANQGIVIAKRGFQSGAYENSKSTNVELYTWEEFQDLLKDKYLKNRVKRYLAIKSKLFRIADNKSEYWKYYDLLNPREQQEVNALQANLMKLVLTLSPMCIMLQYEDDAEIGWDIAQIDKLIGKAEQTFSRTFLSYSDFFKYIRSEMVTIVGKIEKLYKVELVSEKMWNW